MPEDSRIPGHPSDMYSSRPSRPAQGSSIPPPPSNVSYPASSPSPGFSSNNQTRNIFIGAIATIIASTTVYYLTQYVNTRKAESAPSFADKKDATVNAWKNYVLMDNLYYKNIQTLGTDTSLTSNLENYKNEMFKLTDEFVEDAVLYTADKHIDRTFVTMVNRRIKRETNVKDKVNSFYNDLKAAALSNLEQEKKFEKVRKIYNNFVLYSRRIFEMSATEIEELAKALNESYGNYFKPEDFDNYRDYKKGKYDMQTIPAEEKEDTTAAVKNIDPAKLVGTWEDDGDVVTFGKNGSMVYYIDSVEYSTGTWKIEDHKLRIDATTTATGEKTIRLFRIYDLAADRFTMIATAHPHDRYHPVRVKK